MTKEGEPTPRYCKLSVFTNHRAPLEIKFHSVPLYAAQTFLESVNTAEQATLEFDIPSGHKIFTVRCENVIAVDMIVQNSKNDAPKIVPAAGPLRAV